MTMNAYKNNGLGFFTLLKPRFRFRVSKHLGMAMLWEAALPYGLFAVLG
jgi:hypothetical protein